MKLRDKKYWFTSGFYTLFEKVALQVFRFGGVYLLVRVLPKGEYGSWLLFLAVNAFIEVARAGLIRNGLIKFLMDADPEDRKHIHSASLVLNIMFTGLSVLILLGLAAGYHFFWRDAHNLDKLFAYYMVTTVVLIPFYQFNFIQQGNFDFKGSSIANIIREGLFFLYIGFHFLLAWKIELEDLAFFQIIAAAAGSLTSVVIGWKYLSFSYRLDFAWIKKLFHYGKYVLGTNMSTMLIKNIDQFMLGAMVSSSAVAIYGIAIKIANLVEVPTQTIADIVFPQSAKRIKTEGVLAVKYLYERSVGVILALVFPGILFVLLFPKFIIEIVAGEAYLDSVPILQVVMMYGLFVPFARQFSTILDSIGLPRLNFYFVILSLVLNFGLNYFFILYYGTIGAAYGTLATYILMFVFHQIVLYKRLDVKPLNTFMYAHKFYQESFGQTMIFLRKALSRS